MLRTTIAKIQRSRALEYVLLIRQYTGNVNKAIYVKVFKLPDDLETA